MLVFLNSLFTALEVVIRYSGTIKTKSGIPGMEACFATICRNSLNAIIQKSPKLFTFMYRIKK